MRIAYICYWDAYRLDGVAKKILTQTRYWTGVGHRVEIFCLTPRPETPSDPVLTHTTFSFTNIVARLVATRRLAAAVRSFAPDVIYLRYDLFLPPLWGLLAERPLAVELNEQPEEYALRRAKARVYDRWSRRQILRRSDGFICVAEELAQSAWLRQLGRPSSVIGNSIDLDAFPEAAAPRNVRPRAVFLGGPGLAWHGVDKVRVLAEHLPEIDFDVIGPSAEDLAGPAPANLVVHGFLGREQYDPIARRADFAVGTLALHRQGIDETAPLKLREYLAYGLPLVLAHKDPDLTREPHWFVLELPNRESNVDECYEDVRHWAATVKGRRVSRVTAEALVGVRAKETERLDFLERIRVSASRSPT
jgi:hypothetical protein